MKFIDTFERCAAVADHVVAGAKKVALLVDDVAAIDDITKMLEIALLGAGLFFHVQTNKHTWRIGNTIVYFTTTRPRPLGCVVDFIV